MTEDRDSSHSDETAFYVDASGKFIWGSPAGIVKNVREHEAELTKQAHEKAQRKEQRDMALEEQAAFLERTAPKINAEPPVLPLPGQRNRSRERGR